MPSIFLSHTSIDKPFVEKLAVDLKSIGIEVWYDKWEIKIGDSLTRKIEHGIQECEYLAIVLSPEAVRSEWVKNELGAAWAKQMRTKRIVVLPILYRDCEIPPFLEDRRYADFRSDYNSGFAEIAHVLGIDDCMSISRNNWRVFAKSQVEGWQRFRDLEFEALVTRLIDRAREYNWSGWIGKSKNPYSLSLHASSGVGQSVSVSIKLGGRDFAYKASLKPEWNPNNLKVSDFDTYVGNSINECEEYIWRQMEDFRRLYGDPTNEAWYSVQKSYSPQQITRLTYDLLRELSWYKGENLL